MFSVIVNQNTLLHKNKFVFIFIKKHKYKYTNINVTMINVILNQNRKLLKKPE